MNLPEFIYSVVTGPKRRRAAMTAAGFVIFTAVCMGLVVGAQRMDAWLGIKLPIGSLLGFGAGLAVLGLGVLLISWCLAVFLSVRGTPVPFSPPPELVIRGPYSHARNPMVTGLFVSLVGAGLVLRSPVLLFAVVPAVIVGAWIELKLVEEPELERRFGARYVEYKRHVPMFVPRLSGWCRGRSEER